MVHAMVVTLVVLAMEVLEALEAVVRSSLHAVECGLLAFLCFDLRSDVRFASGCLRGGVPRIDPPAKVTVLVGVESQDRKRLRWLDQPGPAVAFDLHFFYLGFLCAETYEVSRLITKSMYSCRCPSSILEN